MSLTMPIDILARGWWVADGYDFSLRRQDMHSRSRSGKLWEAEVISPLWMATWQSRVLFEPDMRELTALMDAVQRIGGSFRAYDVRRLYPSKHKSGAFTDASTISAITNNGRAIALSGLPANFQITAGDLFSYDWRGNQVLHQFAENRQASAGGVLAATEIDPPLWQDVAVATPITLKKPWCKMKIMPGSAAMQQLDQNPNISTISFQGYQCPVGG